MPTQAQAATAHASVAITKADRNVGHANSIQAHRKRCTGNDEGSQVATRTACPVIQTYVCSGREGSLSSKLLALPAQGSAAPPRLSAPPCTRPERPTATPAQVRAQETNEQRPGGAACAAQAAISHASTAAYTGKLRSRSCGAQSHASSSQTAMPRGAMHTATAATGHASLITSRTCAWQQVGRQAASHALLKQPRAMPARAHAQASGEASHAAHTHTHGASS